MAAYYDDYDNSYYNPDDGHDSLDPGSNANWRAIQKGFKDVEGNIDLLDDRLTDAESLLNTLSERVSDVEDAVSGISADLETVKGRLDTAESNITQLRSDVDDLDDRLDVVEDDLSNIDNRLTVAETDIVALKTRVSTAEDNIIALQQTTTNHNSRITALETDLVAVKNRLSAVETDVAVIKTEQTQQNSRLTALEANYAQLLGTVNNLSTRVTRAEDNITALNTSVNSLDGRLDSAEADIDSIEQDLTDVIDDVSDLTIAVNEKVISGPDSTYLLKINKTLTDKGESLPWITEMDFDLDSDVADHSLTPIIIKLDQDEANFGGVGIIRPTDVPGDEDFLFHGFLIKTYPTNLQSTLAGTTMLIVGDANGNIRDFNLSNIKHTVQTSAPHFFEVTDGVLANSYLRKTVNLNLSLPDGARNRPYFVVAKVVEPGLLPTGGDALMHSILNGVGVIYPTTTNYTLEVTIGFLNTGSTDVGLSDYSVVAYAIPL